MDAKSSPQLPLIDLCPFLGQQFGLQFFPKSGNPDFPPPKQEIRGCFWKKSIFLSKRSTFACSISYMVGIRAEKSKNLIRWKRREKAEKADLVMHLAFWQKCQNAIKCHKMTKCLHFGSGSCIRILFLNAYNFGTRGPTKVRRISKWPQEQGLSI